MTTSSPLIGITADDLDARIERAVARALAHAPTSRRDGRTAETTKPGKDWLTNREARTYLGISTPTLQRYRASGRVPYSKVGSRVYYRREHLDAFLSEARVQPDAGPEQDTAPMRAA